MFLHFDHNSFPSIFFGFVWNFPSSKLLLKFVILEIASIFSLLFLSDLLNKLVCKEELSIYNSKPKSAIFPRNRRNKWKEKHQKLQNCLLKTAKTMPNSLKVCNFHAIPNTCLDLPAWKKRTPPVKMILIIIFRLLYIIIYNSSNCDWVYWPYYF